MNVNKSKREIQVLIFNFLIIRSKPAKQHHHGVSLGRDEAQEEDVAAATVVTLQHSLTQRSIFMQRHLFAFGSHQVVHNVAEIQRAGVFCLGVHPDCDDVERE